MKNTRRIKRMSRGRGKKKIPTMNLVSLMDVFTILVFFLLVNSSNTEELPNPKTLKLPDSVAERKPEQTIIVMVTPDEILIKGEMIIATNDVIGQEGAIIEPIRAALEAEANRTRVNSDGAAARRKEVTIMGDKAVPFKLLKKVMASCTSAGYEKISLAVVQKASQS